jgi:outer membrane protein insertion porin family
MGVVSRGATAAILLLWSGLAVAVAEGASPDEAELGWTGRPLAEVSWQVPPAEDLVKLKELAALDVGLPFSPSEVRRAVKALYQLGRFDNVRVEGALTPEGQVALHFFLPPRPVLRQIRLVQSEVLSPGDLEEVARLRPGGPISLAELPAKRLLLAERLARLGYRRAAIGLGLEPVDPSGGFDLVVRIDEGPQTILRQVVVRGSPRLPLRQVSDALGIRRGEVIDLDRLDAALEVLTAEYRRAGYFDVRLEPPQVLELRDTGSGRPLADVLVEIEAGPVVTLRVSGNRTVGESEILRDADLLGDLGTGAAALAELRDRIQARYEKHGFYAAKVELAARRSEDGERKEILVSVEEGPRASVASLNFPGNTAHPDADLADRVHEVVEQALADDLERPGADSAEVGDIIGGRAVRDRGGRVAEPDSTPPDARAVYLAKPYRAAADAIADLYRNAGYQMVQVKSPEVQPRPSGDLLDVTIPIEPGVRWVLGAISFSGNESVPGAELFELSGLDPSRVAGEPMDFARVEEARRAIIKRYQDDGYLYASVAEKLRQVPPRGSLVASEYVRTSSVAPLDAQKVCAVAEAKRAPQCEVEVVFVVDEGPQVKARSVIVRGAIETDEDVVQKQISVQPAAILRAQDMIDTRDNLLRVGVFERVTVRPADESEVAADKDVIIELKERKRYALELGIGASTEEGVRVFASFADSNLAGTALRFQLQGKANYFFTQMLVLYSSEIGDAIREFYLGYTALERLEYEVAAGLLYPRIFSLPPGFSTGLDVIALRNFDPAFKEDTQSATLVANYKGFRPELAGGPRPVGIQLRGGVDRSDLTCNPDIARPELCSQDSTGPDARPGGSSVFATIGPRVSWDLRDDALDPTAGAYVEVGGEVAKGLDDTSNDLAKVDARAQAFVPLAGRIVLAWTFQIGRVFPLETNNGVLAPVPVNRRLFSGGRSTIRGYAEKTLRPQDTTVDSMTGVTNNVSSGGLLSLSLKNELRIGLFGPVSMAIFYDVGDLFESGHFRLQTETTLGSGQVVTRGLAQGAGVGVRVATPIGPLAVDLGIPVSARDDQGPQLHFAVGNF